MDASDLTEFYTVLDACQLHPCMECQQLTLHSPDEVLEQFGPATKLLVRCTHCNAEQEIWDMQ